MIKYLRSIGGSVKAIVPVLALVGGGFVGHHYEGQREVRDCFDRGMEQKFDKLHPDARESPNYEAMRDLFVDRHVRDQPTGLTPETAEELNEERRKHFIGISRLCEDDVNAF